MMQTLVDIGAGYIVGIMLSILFVYLALRWLFK